MRSSGFQAPGLRVGIQEVWYLLGGYGERSACVRDATPGVSSGAQSKGNNGKS